MLQIKNVIAECDDGKHKVRDLSRCNKIIVHRIGPDLGIMTCTSMVDVAKWMKIHPQESHTGGEMPYTFGILPTDGTVEQCLELSDVGPHARRFSTEAVSIACLGDFRHMEPTLPQWTSLVTICIELCNWMGGGNAMLYGHDELQDASKDKNKKCPGRYLDMNTLRNEVRLSLVSNGVQGLKAIGVTF